MLTCLRLPDATGWLPAKVLSSPNLARRSWLSKSLALAFLLHPFWLAVGGGLYLHAEPSGIADHPASPGQVVAQSFFNVAVVADVQYADKPAVGNRAYAASQSKFQEAVIAFNQQELVFGLDLGDLIDGNREKSATDLQTIMAVGNQLKVPWRHVIGNHCLGEMARSDVLKAHGMTNAYYSFDYEGWRFVVLDGMDVSHWSEPDSFEARLSVEYERKGPPFYLFNGAVGPRQMAWLRDTLQSASRRGLPVIVCCHLPTLAAASNPGLLLWNHPQVLRIIENSKCVRAYFAGHDHPGGYAFQRGIHHVTFPGMVESPANAYAILKVYKNRIEILGAGQIPSRNLTWP